VYATDVRQTDVRQHHRLMPPPYGGEGITSDSTLIYTLQRVRRRNASIDVGLKLRIYDSGS